MNLPIPNREAYLKAYPFPHCVIDGVFEDFQLKEMLLHWWPYIGGEMRVGTTNEGNFGRTISDFVKIKFHSQKFISFLEQLTGITGLVLDPREIGLHEIFPGGNLAPHVDYTINERTGLQHRVNAILYLNENWKPEYNGCLELYKDDKVVANIEPIFNRIVIFNIDNAWHGCAEKVACPKGMSRKSIALNYFTAPQSTALNIPTIYKTKNNFIKQFVPPIAWKIMKEFKK